MTRRELAEKLYREGKLASLATPCPLTQEEQEELLLQKVGEQRTIADVDFDAVTHTLLGGLLTYVRNEKLSFPRRPDPHLLAVLRHCTACH